MANKTPEQTEKTFVALAKALVKGKPKTNFEINKNTKSNMEEMLQQARELAAKLDYLDDSINRGQNKDLLSAEVHTIKQDLQELIELIAQKA